MKLKRTTLLIATAALSLGATHLAKAEHIHGLQCGHAANIWSSIDSASQRYAPDRAVDIEQFDLDVTPDFKNRRVAGTATFTFKPILKPLGQLRLDAHDLEISKVTAGSLGIAAWQNTDRALIVTFTKPIAVDEQTKLSVTYEAEPKKGLYFRTPEMGYDPGDT
ncbi:uncharacterized protein METZ01_LOCUS463257, partial [marine metagenome]